MTCKKGQQKNALLKSSYYRISRLALLILKSITESALSFSITTWLGKITAKEKRKLKKIVRTARKLQANGISLDSLYSNKIIQNVTIYIRQINIIHAAKINYV